MVPGTVVDTREMGNFPRIRGDGPRFIVDGYVNL